jgi:hypothetical protein
MQDIAKEDSFYTVRVVRGNFFGDHAQFRLATPILDRAYRSPGLLTGQLPAR